MNSPSRDARPFLAQHLRKRADNAEVVDPNGVHQMARWVENLPSSDARMATIASTGALGYTDGSFEGGPESEGLISTCEVGEDALAREAWLDRFADAVSRYWV